MYAKCKSLNECNLIFNQITHPDVVTWNIMLSGLASTRVYDVQVIKMYNYMNLGQHFKANSVKIAIVVPVCVRMKELRLGKCDHSYAIKSGLQLQMLVGNAFVSMYLKMGCGLVDACKMFDEMFERDVVSWNAMVAGLVFEGFGVFKEMIVEGIWPNYATIANVLPVCALIESDHGYRFGKEIHCYAIHREEVFGDVSVVNSLLGFYSKIGRMKEAESLFKRMYLRDLVSWNSMIAGYASNELASGEANSWLYYLPT